MISYGQVSGCFSQILSLFFSIFLFFQFLVVFCLSFFFSFLFHLSWLGLA